MEERKLAFPNHSEVALKFKFHRWRIELLEAERADPGRQPPLSAEAVEAYKTIPAEQLTVAFRLSKKPTCERSQDFFFPRAVKGLNYEEWEDLLSPIKRPEPPHQPTKKPCRKKTQDSAPMLTTKEPKPQDIALGESEEKVQPPKKARRRRGGTLGKSEGDAQEEGKVQPPEKARRRRGGAHNPLGKSEGEVQEVEREEKAPDASTLILLQIWPGLLPEKPKTPGVMRSGRRL